MRRPWLLLFPLISLVPYAVHGDGGTVVQLKVNKGDAYEIHAWLRDPANVTEQILEAKLNGAPVARKTLHTFDWDWTETRRASVAGTIEIAAPFYVSATLTLRRDASIVPGRTLAEAETVPLNQPIDASADERPFIGSRQDAAELATGIHWYRFIAPRDAVLYMNVETASREVPMDIDLFDKEGQTAREGDHLYRPEATQNLPGLAAFRTRRVRAGQEYFVRVAANHPSYRLHLRTYAAAPYTDPRQAVRTALDYLVSLGDSWLANIPRRGSVATRDTQQHAETQNCVACHPTQFTTRAAVTAKASGYATPAALERILDQLENNPRPLPGHDATNWSRMIFSARTVTSRIPILLAAAGRPRPDIAQGAANYLDLHYKDRTELAGDEADGASPAVSPLEIALQSWQTYGLVQREHPRRAQLEAWIAAYEPKNIVDLNWKIIAHAELGKPTAPLIKALLAQQKPDGSFSYAFGPQAPAAEFVTYHALYALAKAGYKDVSKLVDYTLRHQHAFGGWQGEPVAKAFHTPFRETQFAVMALSTLFPETQPADQVVPARRDASEASTKKADRIAAALYLRQRANAGEPGPLLAVLGSRDPRTRWTGLYAFTAHFRAATRSSPLRHALLQRLEDPAAANRMLAAQGATRWATWDPSPAILDALAARVGVEPDARVRQALQEGIYNLLDDNLGYAEAWMRTMSRDEDRERTAAAMHARSAEQGRILAKHLKGNAAVHLLNAMWDLPLRHMAIPEANRDRAEVVLPAYYAEYREGVPDLASYPPYRDAVSFRYAAGNGFHKTRVGNDSELIDLTGAGPELEHALIGFIEGADLELAVAAVKAGSALGGAMTPRFTAAVLKRAAHPADKVTAAIHYVYAGESRGALKGGDTAELRASLLAALANKEAGPLALEVLAKLPAGSPLVRDAELVAAMEKQLFAPQASAGAIQAAAVFPRVADGPLIRTVIMEALLSGDRAREAAAVEIVVRNYFADPTVAALAEQFGRAAKGRVRRLMVDSLDPERFALNLSALSLYNNPGGAKFLESGANLFSSDVVQEFVRQSLRDPDAQVRAAADDLVRQQPSLRKVLGITDPPPAVVTSRLDYGYFVDFVQPLLATQGGDGKACVQCHASHGTFPLRLPGRGGKFTDAQSRQNYGFAQRVINREEPRKSLILIKPTRPNDSAGDPNLFLATHSGGQRWPGNDTSEAYETILHWIRGASASTVRPPEARPSGPNANSKASVGWQSIGRVP